MILQRQVADTLFDLCQVISTVTNVNFTSVSFQQASTTISRLQAFNSVMDRIMIEDADLLRELAKR